MEHNPHFTEMLQRFNAHNVEFLVVGGYAVMKYSGPQFTKDLDIWIRNAPENGERVYSALAESGAPLSTDQITAEDFSSYDITYPIGRDIPRINIITKIDGVRFQDAWVHRILGRLSGVDVHFICREDLIRNREAAGHSGEVERLRHLRKPEK
ncbi:MAG TPA: hypothetical protein VKZ53_28210 [Candidatus Angelobacter sp.]|nr:hypothetical protein [Candidatus Angelobacter sp.]